MADQPTRSDISLLSGDFYADDPHPCFSWMREHAPVYWDPQGELWGIAKHADVMRVSKDPARFCNSGGIRPDSPPVPSMINMDDPLHKVRRNLVNRGFTPRRVQEHESRIRSICRELIAKVAPRGSCDFVRDIAAPLPLIVVGDLLGVEHDDLDDLLRWSDDLMRGAHATAPPEIQAAAGAASSPVSSARPSIKFMFCTAWPEAPLPRLSSNATSTACPSASLAKTCRRTRLVPLRPSGSRWVIARDSSKGATSTKRRPA